MKRALRFLVTACGVVFLFFLGLGLIGGVISGFKAPPEKADSPAISAVAPPVAASPPITSDLIMSMKYTGPLGKRPVAVAAINVLLRHCPGIRKNEDRFSGVSAAYIEVPDQDNYGNMAGIRMVIAGFTWKAGRWPSGVKHEEAASFVFSGGPGRAITTGSSGAWLCDRALAPGKITISLPADDLSLSDMPG